MVKANKLKINEIIQYLESSARLYPYIDDWKILVLEESTEPIIIMNQIEFDKLEEKIVGNVR